MRVVIARAVKWLSRIDVFLKGCKFTAHYDGPWVPRENESSVYTVLIYLSDEYEGGRTRFLGSDGQEVLAEVEPKTGRAVVFNHDTLHDGQVRASARVCVRVRVRVHACVSVRAG